MQNKLLKISEVKENVEFYPRMRYDWQTGYQYAMAMKSGAVFPLIEVVFINNNYYLVDGKHRLEAYKLNKENYIQATINNKIKTFEELYIRAIQTNIIHGKQLTTQEKVRIALKLKDFKIDVGEISKLISVPIDKFEKFVATRITNTVSGETVFLKAPMRHLNHQIVGDNFSDIQEYLAMRSQLQLIEQLIIIIENDWLDLKNPKVNERIIELTKILDEKFIEKKQIE